MPVMVLDASSLILLTKIDLVDDLGEVFRLRITDTVKEEAAVAGTTDARKIESYIEEGKIETRTVDRDAAEELAEDFNIDTGEASSLLLYRSGEADLVATDDGRTIETCRVMDVHYTTALSLLARAVEKDVVSRERGLAKLEKLEEYGWYGNDLVERVAERIEGEKDG